jgi:hypothetical protein
MVVGPMNAGPVSVNVDAMVVGPMNAGPVSVNVEAMVVGPMKQQVRFNAVVA